MDPVLHEFDLGFLLSLVSDVVCDISGSAMNKDPPGWFTQFRPVLKHVVT